VGVYWASDNFFVTDGQKRDYLSRASRALLRGGTTRKHDAFGPICICSGVAIGWAGLAKFRGSRVQGPPSSNRKIIRLYLV